MISTAELTVLFSITCEVHVASLASVTSAASKQFRSFQFKQNWNVAHITF